MIYKCQRTCYSSDVHPLSIYYEHNIEAPDEATARVMMYNRSTSKDWLDVEKTNVWSDEEWIAT